MDEEKPSNLEERLERCINRIPDISDVFGVWFRISNRVIDYIFSSRDEFVPVENECIKESTLGYDQCLKIYQGKRKRKRKSDPEIDEDEPCSSKKKCSEEEDDSEEENEDDNKLENYQNNDECKCKETQKQVETLCKTVKAQETQKCSPEIAQIAKSNICEDEYLMNIKSNNSDLDSCKMGEKKLSGCRAKKLSCPKSKLLKTNVRASNNTSEGEQVTYFKFQDMNCEKCANQSVPLQTVSQSQKNLPDPKKRLLATKSHMKCKLTPISDHIEIDHLVSDRERVNMNDSLIEKLALMCLKPNKNLGELRLTNEKEVQTCDSEVADQLYTNSDSCDEFPSLMTKAWQAFENNAYRLWSSLKEPTEDTQRAKPNDHRGQREITYTDSTTDCETTSNTSKSSSNPFCEESSSMLMSSIQDFEENPIHDTECNEHHITCISTPNIKKSCSENIRKRSEKILALAKECWEVVHDTGGQNDCDALKTRWDDLSNSEKLVYVWAAIADQIVVESPKENFLFDYTLDKQHKNSRQVKRNIALQTWKCLSAHERLPYVVEALIAKVSTGELNICDCNAIQTQLQKLESTEDCKKL